MKLVDLVSVISERQDAISLYKLNTTSEEYEKIGTYWDIEQIPMIYAHTHVNMIEGFSVDDFNFIRIHVM